MVKGRVDGWFGFDFLLKYVCYGLWLSLVERSVRDREVAGSNPVNPTRNEQVGGIAPPTFFCADIQDDPPRTNNVIGSFWLIGTAREPSTWGYR